MEQTKLLSLFLGGGVAIYVGGEGGGHHGGRTHEVSGRGLIHRGRGFYGAAGKDGLSMRFYGVL